MKFLKTITVFALLSVSCSIYATEYCVTNAVELHNALTAAESNSAHDTVRIAEGSYVATGAPFSYQEVNGWDLTISGGWTEFFGNPCGQQLDSNPYGTVLDGDLASTVLEIRLAFNSDVTVSGLSFINGKTPIDRGGAINVSHINNLETGKVTIERNVFINNEADFGSALYIRHADKVYIRNNLFVANHAHTRYVISVLQQDAYGTFFTNNTVVNNTASTDGTAGLGLAGGGGTQLFVANNVMRENDNADFRNHSGLPLYLKNNNIDVLSNVLNPVEDIGNMDLPPRFEDILLSFTPAENSPLVNAGVKPCSTCPIPIPFDEAWVLGTIDLAGNVRNQNGKVDIGAFESSHNNDLIFWGTFGD